MNINFQETYKSLSTAELLNIVKQTNDYQPEAVLAAIALLKERTITDSDHTEAEQIIADTKANWINENQYRNIISTKIESLVEPIVKPETTLNPQKWINILMTTLGIYTIWTLIRVTIRLRRLSEINHLEYFSFYDIVQPLYLLVTIGGLYKRKKWGWVLLMIFFILETITFAFGIYLSIKYSFFRMHFRGEVAATLISTGAVFLLSLNHTRTYFKINERLLRNTVFSAIIIFLLVQVFFKYFQ